jgi:hypothetical protein
VGAAVSETELSASIRGALEANNFWVIRMNSSGRRGPRSVASGERGMPDLHLVALGAWLEVKLPDGELSADQKAWHFRAQQAGVRVAIVRSVHEALRAAMVWRDSR